MTRRTALVLAGLAWFRRPILSAGPAPGWPERLTLDLGYHGARGGPVTALRDGSLLWATTEPEAPYTAKAMWPISRLTLRRSRDGGRGWTDPVAFLHGTRDYSLLSHALRVTRAGTLLHVFVRYSGYDYESASPAKSLCEVFYHRSTDAGRTWSEPRKMPTGERYNGDILSLTELTTGRLVYPCAFLTANHGQFATTALYSDDDGRTWTRSRSVLQAGGGGFESGANEPSVAELPDGRLWMLIRAQTGFQWQSYSNDGGVTWSDAAPSAIPSSNAPATLLRLKNGKIAIAWNNHVQGNYARQSLVLGITADGRRFEGAREIDATSFPDNPAEPIAHVTYPYLTEAADGTIVVSYNKGHWMRHNRPALARVRPEWIAAREDVIDFRNGRSGWHTVNPGPNRTAAVERYATAADSEDLWLEIEQNKGSANAAGVGHSLPLVAEGEVDVDLQVVRPDGYLLFSDSLLPPGAAGEACVRVRAAGGRILVATGTPRTVQRNRGTTVYSYLGYPVEREAPYPLALPADGRLRVRLRYSASRSAASISINGGPVVDLKTGPILGLTCMGLAVEGGGVLRVRSIHTRLTA
ncbi:MAG: exo-alpha-sialidase [Bryobacterales bacterium]|nr:exo-alpha-sialidase [Bryobacterales bacterium]